MAPPGGNVVEITEDDTLDSKLAAAGSKLVVVDFSAKWCGPCHAIAPKFAALSEEYTSAIFYKVDVDQCPSTATGRGITAMPSFHFYKSQQKVDELRGADPKKLEEKVTKWAGGDGDQSDTALVKGHMDLTSFLSMSESECLNESDEHTMKDCLTPGDGYLASDCDEQLILHLTFSQPIKLHSIKMAAPDDKGPKTLKVFQNQPHTLNFDDAESRTATQDFVLKPEDFKDDGLIQLKYVKFQNVQNVTLFIKDNQSGDDETVIKSLQLVGTPVNATNMAEFKRVAGKKGESH